MECDRCGGAGHAVGAVLHLPRERRLVPSSQPACGLGHGLLILAVLWWAWAAYAWLTNTADPGEGAVWGAMLVAMAAMFVAALAIRFFGPLIGGMSGWRVQPAHFVERHGLIVIIAIGESLIVIGLGERST